MNIVLLSGNLVEKPELRSLESGDVVNFTVANTKKFTSKDGEKKEETIFVNCTAWNQSARFLSEYCDKGTKVMVEGSWRTDKWQNDEGENRYKDGVRVNRLEKLSYDKPKEAVATAKGGGSDIPFD